MPQLATKQTCTGCSACASACRHQCIRMCADGNGFLFPTINQEHCIDCKLCEKVCPVLNKQNPPEQNTQAYAAYSLNDELRAQSSSGGFFTELAQMILKNHGAVYGAAYDSDFLVHHICALNSSELAKLRGAKYAQSELGGCFIEIEERLRHGQQVLFTGTPCQVAGLKSFLRREYGNLSCVDFVCHGVPSPMAWQQYVKFRAEKDNHGILPKTINLRSKHTGWSRYQYSNLYQYADEIQYSTGSGDDLFMKLFVGDYINRESCAVCSFKGYDRISDFTIGDFWGIWDIDPDMDDNKGTSLVLVHTVKGRNLLGQMQRKLKMKSVSLEQASLQNPSLLKSSPIKRERSVVLKEILRGEVQKQSQLFPMHGNTGIVCKIKGKVASILRSSKRRMK